MKSDLRFLGSARNIWVSNFFSAPAGADLAMLSYMAAVFCLCSSASRFFCLSISSRVLVNFSMRSFSFCCSTVLSMTESDIKTSSFNSTLLTPTFFGISQLFDAITNHFAIFWIVSLVQLEKWWVNFKNHWFGRELTRDCNRLSSVIWSKSISCSISSILVGLVGKCVQLTGLGDFEWWSPRFGCKRKKVCVFTPKKECIFVSYPRPNKERRNYSPCQ